MKENHTLQSHRLKESRLNKNQTVAEKSSAFTTGTEEFSSETGKDLSNIFPSSVSSDAQSSVSTFSPPASSEAYIDLEISINSDDVSMERFVFHKIDGYVEVDIVSSFLEKVRNQEVNSADAEKQSKKLVDALMKVVLEECYDERTFCADLVSGRRRILFLCILLCSGILSLLFSFGLLSDGSYHGLLPT